MRIIFFVVLTVLAMAAYGAEIHDAARAGDLAKVKAVLASFDSIFERTQDERKKAPQSGQQTGLQGPYFGQTSPGEATIWYLGHCGFAVKTETKLLVFDYVKKPMRRDDPAPQPPAQPALSNGWINPEEIKDLDVVVFVSHNHGDHYDEVIRTWAKTVKNIHYVFGWDAGTGANIHSLAAPRASAKFDGLEIETVNSHHSGVPESAFLVKADGLTIYHNGDYVGRMGDYNTAPSNVPADMDYLKTKFKTVDILFLDAFVADYQIQILQSLKPNVLFPMHYGGQEEKLEGFAADLKKAGVEIPVYCPAKPGDRFEYRNGKIVQSPTRESTDVSPWRDSSSPAPGTGDLVCTHETATSHECAPMPEISRSPGREFGELQ